MKDGALELQTWLAPIPLSRAACSALRTMFTSGTLSLRQILLSICPRLEAAAVCTSALWPSARMVATMPSAVSGLTNQEAPSAGVVPSGSTRHVTALRHRILGVHAAAHDGDRLAEQGLGGWRRPGADDHAGRLVADGHRLIDAARPGP